MNPTEPLAPDGTGHAVTKTTLLVQVAGIQGTAQALAGFPRTPHEAALSVPCSQCEMVPGVPCQRHPDGCHLARFCTAYKEHRLTAAEVTAVFDSAPVIANYVVITGGVS
jgi:hypothetical protein